MNLQVNQEFINSVWQKFSEKYLSDEEEWSRETMEAKNAILKFKEENKLKSE
jgi:hypothetical protein